MLHEKKQNTKMFMQYVTFNKRKQEYIPACKLNFIKRSTREINWKPIKLTTYKKRTS